MSSERQVKFNEPLEAESGSNQKVVVTLRLQPESLEHKASISGVDDIMV